MKVTVTQILVDAFGTVTKGLVQELEDLGIRWRVDTTQNTVLLKSVRILRRVWEAWGVLLSLQLQCCWCENFFKEVKKIIIKETERVDKCLDLARKLKKKHFNEVTVKPFVVVILGTVLKGLEKRRGLNIILIIRILKRVMEIWRDFLSLRIQRK